jgi:hypothetical protein
MTTGRIGTCAGRFSWRDMLRCGVANGTTGECLGLTVLRSMILALLLMIGGTEQNHGLLVEVEKSLRLLCAGCGRNGRSELQYELCERWYHCTCGSVKTQAVERERERERSETVKSVGLKR